jgi:hypothetical protein
MARFSDNFSFLTGAGRFRDLLYLAAVNDEFCDERQEHTIPLEWDNGTWRYRTGDQTLMWATTSICVASHPLEQAVFLGYGGDVLCMGSGDSHLEVLRDGAAAARDRGPMRGVDSGSRLCVRSGAPGMAARCGNDLAAH